MSRFSSAVFILIALLLLGPVPAPLAESPGQGQSQAGLPPTEAQQRPVFRAGANFVRVDVYPRRDGRIVEGLTADDLQVYEDGVLQEVDTFEFLRVEGFTPDAERRDPRSMAEADRQAADPRTRVFILYLDGQHMQVEGARAAAQPALDFLRRAMGPRDLFGVMTPTMTAEQVTLGRQITTVEQEIADYWDTVFVDRATDSILYPESPHEKFIYDCFMNRGPDITDGERVVRRLWEIARAERALENLRWMSARMGGIREFRTHVLLFSGGWELEGPDTDLLSRVYGGRQTVSVRNGRLQLGSWQPGDPPDTAACDGELSRLAFIDFRRLFDDLLEAADTHNVSFYPIDPAGLAAFDDDITDRRAGRGFVRGTRRLDPLRSLASETEGLALVGTSNIIEPLRQVADDFSAFYLLGYYSQNSDFDGEYRRIEVRTTLDDVDIAARRGYLAPSAEMLAAAANASAGGPDVEPGFAEALESLGRLGSPSDLFVTGAARGPDLLVIAEAADGALGRGIPDGTDVRLRALDGSGETVTQVEGALEPGRRGLMLRLPGAAAGDGPWTVSVSVDGGIITEQAEIHRDRPGPIGDPVVYRTRPARVAPLWPAAQMTFRSAERVHIEWAIQAPLEAQSARLLSVAGEELAVPVALAEVETDGQAALAADLRLAPLGAGDYIVEVSATAGGTTVQRFVAIRVAR